MIIGINAYKSWPKLSYAVNDARAVRDTLMRKYGFAADHITTLLDGEATREAILAALGDSLADGKKVARDDRVLVFFAGHGVTRKLPSGKSQGYIVPVDAALQNYQSQAISMTNFQDASDAIPAKHLFFVMDACYSGLALTRAGGGARSGDRRQYLMEITRRSAREVLTAGGGDEQVADNGPNGHSIFTWTLLQGLEGRADLDSDGAITATELAAYVGPGVSSLSRQTPAFGHMAGSEGGEFVFVLQRRGRVPERGVAAARRRGDQAERGAGARAQADRGEAGAQREAEGGPGGGGAGARRRGRAAGRRRRGGGAGGTLAAAAPPAAGEAGDPARREVQRGHEPVPREALPGGRGGVPAGAAPPARARDGDQQSRLHLLQAGALRRRRHLVREDHRARSQPRHRAREPGRRAGAAGCSADAKRAYQKFLELQPQSPSAPHVQRKLAQLP